MKKYIAAVVLGILAGVCFQSQGCAQQTGRGSFTDTFPVDRADLTSTGRNSYFILEPGYTCVFEGKAGRRQEKLKITVLGETRIVDGVETRIVEEREWEGDELIEVSRNFFTICSRTNDVYYFGEEVDMYENGEIVSHEGAWLSGEDDARFGLMMAGAPLVGSRYYQEIAPGKAMDRAEIISLDESVETPAGSFTGCLKARETNPLEGNEKEFKYYAPGIGLVQDEDLKLVSYGKK